MFSFLKIGLPTKRHTETQKHTDIHRNICRLIQKFTYRNAQANAHKDTQTEKHTEAKPKLTRIRHVIGNIPGACKVNRRGPQHAGTGAVTTDKVKNKILTKSSKIYIFD